MKNCAARGARPASVCVLARVPARALCVCARVCARRVRLVRAARAARAPAVPCVCVRALARVRAPRARAWMCAVGRVRCAGAARLVARNNARARARRRGGLRAGVGACACLQLGIARTRAAARRWSAARVSRGGSVVVRFGGRRSAARGARAGGARASWRVTGAAGWAASRHTAAQRGDVAAGRGGAALIRARGGSPTTASPARGGAEAAARARAAARASRCVSLTIGGSVGDRCSGGGLFGANVARAARARRPVTRAARWASSLRVARARAVLRSSTPSAARGLARRASRR